jgi:hypothetical protein
LGKRPVEVLDFVVLSIGLATWWSSLALLGEEVDMVEFGLVSAEAVVVVVVVVVVDIAAMVVDIVVELLLEVAETTLGKID